jgi:hypothetical protein
MTAITFAGANALKAVRQVVEKEYVEDEKTVFLMKKINRKGISVDIYAEKADLWLAIKIFLGQRTAIYIVLLSLNMSNSEHLKVRELSRIVKITSRTLIKKNGKAGLMNQEISIMSKLIIKENDNVYLFTGSLYKY